LAPTTDGDSLIFSDQRKVTMRKQAILVAAALILATTDYVSAAHAAGAVRGTKEKITFEGIIRQNREGIVPNGFDGFNWSNVNVNGRRLLSGGAAKVVHGRTVAIVMQGEGTLSPETGTFWLQSGHFAATCNGPTDATFSAYMGGVLLGQLNITLQPADTKLQFDKTFSHADQVVMQGSDTQGCTNDIAMDNLQVVLQ
jgi:hypothetical protein